MPFTHEPAAPALTISGNATFAQAYCPMVLSYRSENWTPGAGRQWMLSFRQKPTLAVTLEGDAPTREEIIAACKWLPWISLAMVDLIECVAGQLVADRGAAS